ncbi:MAG TPA: HNH endonuclease, partial [Woeseiaceae bacterium]|nr:HNH endonuclease [Woeseiaceae bacterium]
VRRLACDSELIVLVEDGHGEPLNVGRKTRVVPAALKRALWARDKGCRFPGCGRRRFVDAHHVRHWANGGETSLGNLLLLCNAHHSLVHEGGLTIEKDYRDRWFFRRPDGRAVPECGYRPEDVTDDGAGTAGEYFEGDPSAEVGRASAKAPCGLAEAGMMEAHGVKEPAPEIYASAGRLAAITLSRKRAALH